MNRFFELLWFRQIQYLFLLYCFILYSTTFWYIFRFTCFTLYVHLFADFPCHADTICRCLLKSSCDRCSVSHDAQILDICLKFIVHYDFIRIKFYFHAVKQSLIRCNSGCYFIECLNHLIYRDHDTSGNTSDKSPGTASFNVGVILFLCNLSAVVLRPLLKSP